MAAQKGSDLLFKVEGTGSPTSFVTIGGLRTKTLTFNREQVDTTNSDSVNKWREMLAGAGVKSASLSADGVFLDDTSHENLRAHLVGDTIPTCQIVIPDFYTIEGAFDIASFEFSGEHNAEVDFSITLESAGELQFTAA